MNANLLNANPLNAPDRHPLHVQPEMEDEQRRLDHDGFVIVSQPSSRKRCVVRIPKREFKCLSLLMLALLPYHECFSSSPCAFLALS